MRRAVGAIGVAFHPPNVSHASEAVIGADVEDVFDGEGVIEEVSAYFEFAGRV